MNKIIFVSPVKFENLKQRHQGISQELSNNNYIVYYINPLRSNGFSCNITKLTENFIIIDIKIPFKSISHPLIQNFVVKIALKLLKKKLHIPLSENILWLAEPSCAALTDTKWGKIIYDCCDLHGLFPNQKQDIWEKYETKIINKADLITISHPYIKNHFSKDIQSKTRLIPNATFFKTEKRIKKIEKKIKLLSSGAHYEWVDIDWIKNLASIENIEINIAGKGRGKNFNQLLLLKNVIFHGELNQKQLFKLINECDVGLVPFKNIELIKGVDPIKAYDYAAAGLEIWAPDIESLHSNPYISSFISDKKSINKAINKLKEQKSISKQIETIPTWKDRVRDIINYIEIAE